MISNLKKNNLLEFLPSSIVATSLLFFGYPAFAQETKSSLALEEIVVTAQRKEQSLVDVPIAVQAFNANTLKQAGVDSLAEINLLSPSVKPVERVSALIPYIRGVGTSIVNVGNEQPVGVYVDDVYHSNPFVTIFSLNNIQRAEILKGPQGTLFGRNTTGGVIHVVTKDPGEESEINASLSYSDYETTEAKFYGSNAISNEVAADVAVYYRDQGEGYGFNQTLMTDHNVVDEKAFRTKWLITPSDATQIRLTLDYADVETSALAGRLAEGSIGGDGQFIFAGCVAGLGGDPSAPTVTQATTCQPIAIAGATQAPEDFYDSFSNRPQQIMKESWGFSGKVNHTINDSLEFVSITGYRDSRVDMDFEQAATIIEFATILNRQDYETFTQEFQLISEGDKLDWILGAYYFNDTSEFAAPDGLKVIVPSENIVQNIFSGVDKESYSIFGELSYELTDNTSLTAGLRLNKDEVDAFWDERVAFSGIQIASAQDTASDSWTEPTYRVILDHHLTDNTMVYGSYSRGYKSGSYNTAGALGTPAFDPEFVDAYEVGLKTTLFDGRAQLNTAAWFYDLKNLQVSRVVAGSSVVINAAEAEISGIEMDFVANITERLTVSGGLTAIDAEYISFPDAIVTVPTGFGGNINTAQDIAGSDIPWVSDFTFSLGGTYDIPTDFGAVRLDLNVAYNDGFQLALSGRNVQESFEQVNASVTWTHPSDTWGLRAFGKNLTDSEYYTGIAEQSVGDTASVGRPRVVGLEVFLDM